MQLTGKVRNHEGGSIEGKRKTPNKTDTQLLLLNTQAVTLTRTRFSNHNSMHSRCRYEDLGNSSTTRPKVRVYSLMPWSPPYQERRPQRTSALTLTSSPCPNQVPIPIPIPLSTTPSGEAIATKLDLDLHQSFASSLLRFFRVPVSHYDSQ